MSQLGGIAACAAVLLFCVPAQPQAIVPSGSKQDQNQDQAIRVTTRLVQVEAIVRDKRGAVDGLAQSDFTLLDNGKPRAIAAFSIAKTSAQSSRSQLPAGTYSNKVNQPGDSPLSATIILFDSLNMQFMDQAAARLQTLKLLRSIDPQSPVAIYSLGNSFRILHDFTDDRARLARALERYRGENSRFIADSVPPTDDILAQVFEPLQRYTVERRATMTLASLRAIANRVAGVAGRKNLIWISSAFPLVLAFDRGGFGLNGVGQNDVNYSGPLKDTAQALDRANVAIYPVNAGTTVTLPRMSAADNAPPLQRNPAIRAPVRIPGESDGTRERDTMRLLADWTGGKAFLNSNDIQGAIRQAMEDAEIVYTLGFYVDSNDLDSSYHNLKVKIGRKGLDVRHRQGYFATPPASAAQSLADIVVNSAFAPVDATGIGLTASLKPTPADPALYTLQFTIDFQNIHLEEANGKWTGGLTFLALEQSDIGKVTDSAPHNISIDITEARRQTLMQEGLSMRLTVKPSPNMSQIRLAVVDQGSGNVGSLRIRPLVP